MKTLKEIKSEVAKELGFKTWSECFLKAETSTEVLLLLDLVTERYAEQYAKKIVENDQYAQGWLDATNAAVEAVKKNYEPKNSIAG